MHFVVSLARIVSLPVDRLVYGTIIVSAHASSHARESARKINNTFQSERALRAPTVSVRIIYDNIRRLTLCPAWRWWWRCWWWRRWWHCARTQSCQGVKTFCSTRTHRNYSRNVNKWAARTECGHKYWCNEVGARLLIGWLLESSRTGTGSFWSIRWNFC